MRLERNQDATRMQPGRDLDTISITRDIQFSVLNYPSPQYRPAMIECYKLYVWQAVYDDQVQGQGVYYDTYYHRIDTKIYNQILIM